MHRAQVQGRMIWDQHVGLRNNVVQRGAPLVRPGTRGIDRQAAEAAAPPVTLIHLAAERRSRVEVHRANAGLLGAHLASVRAESPKRCTERRPTPTARSLNEDTLSSRTPPSCTLHLPAKSGHTARRPTLRAIRSLPPLRTIPARPVHSWNSRSRIALQHLRATHRTRHHPLSLRDVDAALGLCLRTRILRILRNTIALPTAGRVLPSRSILRRPAIAAPTPQVIATSRAASRHKRQNPTVRLVHTHAKGDDTGQSPCVENELKIDR